MTTLNEMKLEFKSQTANISFGRAAVAAFVSQLDPILSEVEDISTAVSEAITNAVVHGYKGDPNGIIRISFACSKRMKSKSSWKISEWAFPIWRQPKSSARPPNRRSGSELALA